MTELFGADGSVAASQAFDPWGTSIGRDGEATSPLGFQGDWSDPSTGKVWMGARWYTPGTASFTARDTVFGQLSTPVSLNRYTYAFNSPLAMFDPDGHWPDFLDSAVSAVANTVSSGVRAIGSALSGGARSISSAVSSAVSSVREVAHSVGSAVSSAVSTVSHAVSTATRASARAVSTVYSQVRRQVAAVADQARRHVGRALDVARQVPSATTGFLHEHAEALRQGVGIVLPLLAGVAVTGACVAGTAGLGTPACMALGGAAAGAVSGAMQCTGQTRADCLRGIAVNAGAGAIAGFVGGTGGTLVSGALRGGLADASYTGVTQLATTGRLDWTQIGQSFATGTVLAGSLHAASTGASRARRGATDAPGANRTDHSPQTRRHSCATFNSFTGGTLVLMGDGTKKPIKDVEVGDEVTATNPVTGERAAKPVTGVWVHQDTVLDLTLAPRGPPVRGETITTTADHPFYNATDRRFEDIADFDPGDQVLTVDGRLLNLHGLDPTSTRTATAYNLTVADTHTYHVGHHAVLVHNCGNAANGGLPPRDAQGRFTSGAGGDSALAATRRSAHQSYAHTLGGGDYQFNRSPFPDSRIRPDAFSISRSEIRELKPNTASGISTGNRQLAGYKSIFEEYFGGTWTTYLDTYQP